LPRSTAQSPSANGPLPTFYTYEEAGEILKMSRKQVIRACEEGRLGFIKIHERGRRITSDHIREFMVSRDVRPAA